MKEVLEIKEASKYTHDAMSDKITKLREELENDKTNKDLEAEINNLRELHALEIQSTINQFNNQIVDLESKIFKRDNDILGIQEKMTAFQRKEEIEKISEMKEPVEYALDNKKSIARSDTLNAEVAICTKPSEDNKIQETPSSRVPDSFIK